MFLLAVVFLGRCLAQDVQQPVAPAPTFAPAAGQTFYLDLDTAEGAFSQWRHKDLGSLSALRATLRVPTLRKNNKFVPAFSVWLQNTEAGKVQNSMGLQLFAPDRKPPLSIRIVQAVAGKSSFESSNRTIGLDENLTVEIDWQTAHTVTIKIGESETHTINIPWSVDTVSVTASTGQMKADPLVLGSIVK